MTPNFKSRPPQRKNFWSAPAKRSGDGALDYSAAELQTIQSGVALRLPPQSKNLRFSSLDLHTKVFDDGIRQHFARHPFGLGARLGFAERTIDGNLEILSLANIADAAITEQLDRMLDRFALRIQDARLQRDVNLGFHVGHVSEPQAVATGSITQGPLVSRVPAMIRSLSLAVLNRSRL